MSSWAFTVAEFAFSLARAPHTVVTQRKCLGISLCDCLPHPQTPQTIRTGWLALAVVAMAVFVHTAEGDMFAPKDAVTISDPVMTCHAPHAVWRSIRADIHGLLCHPAHTLSCPSRHREKSLGECSLARHWQVAAGAWDPSEPLVTELLQ